MQEARKPASGRLQLVETPGSTNPKLPSRVFVNRDHVIAAQAGGVSRIMPVMDESFSCWFEAVETALGTNPKFAAMIAIYATDIIAAQARRVSGLIAIVRKSIPAWIELVEAPKSGADPKAAIPILV